MTTVTVPGAGGSKIGETFGNPNNTALAQHIANVLAGALNAGNLDIVVASSTSVGPPPSNPGGVQRTPLLTPAAIIRCRE